MSLFKIVRASFEIRGFLQHKYSLANIKYELSIFEAHNEFNEFRSAVVVVY